MHEGLAVYVVGEVITQPRESNGLTYLSARQLRPDRRLSAGLPKTTVSAQEVTCPVSALCGH